MDNSPIITSLLDDDQYKINMGSVVFHAFPRAIVTYGFTNRGKTPFPPGFDEALLAQIEHLSALRLTYDEAKWLKTIPYMRPTYVEWLQGFQMDPSEVTVKQVGGELSITIKGPWYRTIYWEVKLMAIISELYFRMTNQPATGEWKTNIYKKAVKLSGAYCHWIDFGTRRRHSLEVQDKLVEIMKDYKGFLGTSNPFLAMKYGIKSHGTYAHECIMAMSALYGFRMADKMWRKHWAEHFHGDVGVALTDTYTSKVFWRDFDTYDARLFDGCRQDSGDEYEWGIRMVEHYAKLGIPVSNKRMVFSNALDTDKYIAIDQYFRKFAQPCGGIGTHFSNDVGVKPLNMVIKMTSADFGAGFIPVIKLSDDAGKNTGDPLTVELAKRELNIP